MVVRDDGTTDRPSDTVGWTVSDYDVFLADCPARTTLELISDTWSVVVLVGLAHGPRRYSYLLDRAGGISKKMLTSTLWSSLVPVWSSARRCEAGTTH
jgi:DNA-binding HxlR family transcriptional regulator